jgi:hypothetical protein
MSYDTIKAESERRNRLAKADNILIQIKHSTNVGWLKAVLGDQEYQFAVRQAAQRRLSALHRKPRL